MKIWQETWWLVFVAFSGGEAFEYLWLTNNPLRTLGFVIGQIVINLLVWGLWWLMKNFEVRKRS